MWLSENRNALVVCWLAVSTSVGLGVALYRDQPPPDNRIVNRPIQVSEDGYVSSRTCKACHPAQYDAWHAERKQAVLAVERLKFAVA